MVAPHKGPDVLYVNDVFFGSRNRETHVALKKKSGAFKKNHETNLLMTPLKHSFKKGGEGLSSGGDSWLPCGAISDDSSDTTPKAACLTHFQSLRRDPGIWSHRTGGTSPVTRNNRVRRPD